MQDRLCVAYWLSIQTPAAWLARITQTVGGYQREQDQQTPSSKCREMMDAGLMVRSHFFAFVLVRCILPLQSLASTCYSFVSRIPRSSCLVLRTKICFDTLRANLGSPSRSPRPPRLFSSSSWVPGLKLQELHMPHSQRALDRRESLVVGHHPVTDVLCPTKYTMVKLCNTPV